MSNRQMEEMQEEQFNRALAEELGITLDELYELDPECVPEETSDGMIVSYTVTFDKENSDPNILSKISGLVDGYWLSVRPFAA